MLYISLHHSSENFDPCSALSSLTTTVSSGSRSSGSEDGSIFISIDTVDAMSAFRNALTMSFAITLRFSAVATAAIASTDDLLLLQQFVRTNSHRFLYPADDLQLLVSP
jgi:hypothetical protein